MIECAKINLVTEFNSIDLDVRTNGQHTLENSIPPNPLDVSLQITLHIGVENDIRRDLFETIVETINPSSPCYPGVGSTSLRSKVKSIIVKEYNWQDVKNKLIDIVKDCERANWIESRNQLRKVFYWEYEGMDSN